MFVIKCYKGLVLFIIFQNKTLISIFLNGCFWQQNIYQKETPIKIFTNIKANFVIYENVKILNYMVYCSRQLWWIINKLN